MENIPLQIMIHDLTPWGGQDRSMLEIAWQLNKSIPLEIHSYQLAGYDNWPKMRHHRYKSLITRPVLFKYLSYHWQSFRRSNPDIITQSTGTAALRSDVIQIQFIHHEWQRIQQELPPDKTRSHNFFKNTYHAFLSRYKLAMERTLYTPSKRYIAISHGIKKELIQHFDIPAQNIDIIYHGVDPELFCPWQEAPGGKNVRQKIRSQHGFSDDDVVLLHVGALNGRKGIFKTLEVMKALKDNNFHSIKLVAVGQGDQNVLQKVITEYGIEDRVTLCSHSQEVQAYYQASDIFFFPTIYEPFGLVILEAMACGLPVVTSTTAGASELIISGKNGLLVDPFGDAFDMVQQMNTLLKNESLRAQMGAAGRKVAARKNWEYAGDQYREFYETHFQFQQKLAV